LQSIIQTEKECYVTGSTYNLHRHHIYGGSNRKKSEQNGLWVWLRADWHNMSDYGVHFNKKLDTELKQLGQSKFEETPPREKFMSLIGRSYL
jgi:hypothetical protein